MWSDAHPGMTQAEFRAWQSERLPPDNEMPRVIGLNADLVRTSDKAVTLTHCLVYSRGVSFQLTAVFGVDDDDAGSHGGDGVIAAASMPMTGTHQADLVLSLELADGTALRAPVGESSQEPFLLRHTPRSAHMSGLSTALWLTPLPPPGPLTSSVECPSLGIEPAYTTVDATSVRNTADGVTPLWNGDI